MRMHEIELTTNLKFPVMLPNVILAYLASLPPFPDLFVHLIPHSSLLTRVNYFTKILSVCVYNNYSKIDQWECTIKKNLMVGVASSARER